MLLIKATLCGYKRLALNQIQYIEITPKSKIQMVLGTNGSGKSSLIKELSPLPGLHQEYAKDGYKVMEYRHNHSHYVLKSLFTSTGNKYHFEKDGVDLNRGGTATTFRELVKQEFGITPEIHELMTGQILFHQMSVAERRSWFTKIADADYTYAIQYYQRLRDRHRDLSGAIKLQNARLVQESQKLIDQDQEKTIREEIKHLQMVMTKLLRNSSGEEVTENLSHKTKHLQDRIAQLSQNLIETSQVLLDPQYQDFDTITRERYSSQARLVMVHKRCDALMAEMDRQSKTLEMVKANHLQSHSDLNTRSEQYKDEISTLRRSKTLHLEIAQPQVALTALKSLHADLSHLFCELEDNSQRKYTRTKYQEAVNDLNRLTAQCSHLDKLILTSKEQLAQYDHAIKHNQIQCPSCEHVWTRGYNQAEHETLKATLASQLKSHEQSTEKISQLKEYIEKASHYFQLYQRYVSITNACPVLLPLWDYIRDTSLILDQPLKCSKILEELALDLTQDIHIQRLIEKLDELTVLQKSMTDSKDNNLQTLEKSLNKNLAELKSLQEESTQTKALLKKLESCESHLRRTQDLKTAVRQAVRELNTHTYRSYQQCKLHYLNEVITSVRLQIVERERVVSRVDIQKALVENIRTQITQMTEQAEVLRYAMSELSPTEGLIAKGLTGFINHFVSRMNLFIKRVWSYPLEIVALQPDEDFELDYKFEMRVGESKDLIPDISKGSSGIKEIIDLAYKVVAMSFLGLEQAPLYLDELGARFDPQHRSSVNAIINTLAESSNVTQVFIISHFHEVYGSFKNSDVTVLCPSNLPLFKDGGFNSSTIIR